jgi:amino acid transporter
MPAVASWSHHLGINISTCLVLLAGAVWLCYRGATATKAIQYALVALQMVVLVWYAVAAWRAAGPSPALAFSWDWLNPFSIGSFRTFAAGVSLSIFIYWGWDVCLTMNEECTDSERTPGRAAGLVILILLALYTAVSIATMRFAGLGETGLGLANPQTRENVLAAMSVPVMGPFAILVALAVLASSVASLQSTFVSPARTLLAMGHYRAITQRFSWIHPKYRSPGYATIAAGLASAGFYVAMHLFSRHVLADTILTLGMMVCFYYGLTAFACVYYFRHSIFQNAHHFFFRGLAPLAGGIVLTIIFVGTTLDSMSPEYGSGSSIFGVGLVFLLAVTIISIGIILMFIISWHRPSFFRGETLRRDTPLFKG